MPRGTQVGAMKVAITSDACRSCGACCVSAHNSPDAIDYGYADVTTEDVARLSRHVRRQLHESFVGGETHYSTKAKELPTGEFVCRHLRGTPGERCSCTIYQTRPEICAKFPVGGPICREARLVLGVDPPRKAARS